MVYSFDSRLAEQYGVDEAIFLHNLYYWIAKNEANGRHHYDGRSWTYNSMAAFTQLFPFWSRRQIERIIRNLKEKGAIYTGNYNPVGFDRTQWYALDETVYSMYANGDAHFTERGRPFHQSVEPIPDSKPNSKPDVDIPPLPPTDLFAEFWAAYPKKVKKPVAMKSFSRQVKDQQTLDLILTDLKRRKAADEWAKQGGKFIPHPSTYLNDRRWEDEDGAAELEYGESNI